MGPDFHCGICGYDGEMGLLPCACADGPCAPDAPAADCGGPRIGCPVCLDGAVDPWSLIREIRAEIDALVGSTQPSTQPSPSESIPLPTTNPLESPPPVGPPVEEQAVPTAAIDPFESEWDLLRMSILSIWSDLSTEELAVAQGSRVRFEGLLRRRYGYGTALAHQLTNGLQDLHERFNGRWEMVAECIPKYWPEISVTEISRMNGTISELAGLVERRYTLPPGDGRQEVASFLQKIDYPLLVRLFRGAGPLGMNGVSDKSDASSSAHRETAS